MSSHVRRILIADEYDMVRRGLRAFLELRPNLQVVAEAPNGRTALEAARRTKPNIVILDYALPELNGIDLTHALKREMPRTEVMIFTRHDREDLILNALRAGAKGYVRKADPEEHIFSAIEALSVGRPYFSGGASEKVLERVLERARCDQPTLTHREREIVQLIAEGRLNKEIAGVLDLSVKTVETHRAAAMDKLSLRNTAQLVRYALRNKMIEA